MTMILLTEQQRRTVILTSHEVCLGLEDGSREMLDSIPLHEITGVRKSAEDFSDLFNILDVDEDGILSVQVDESSAASDRGACERDCVSRVERNVKRRRLRCSKRHALAI